MRFLNHLDLLRVVPRMFRRAGIELAFSRGYNPLPRMTFGAALALGVAADEEAVDIDVLLPRSDEDMAGLLSPEDRLALGEALLERLRAVAPPGLELVAARMVEPGEAKLAHLVEAADYEVDLPADIAARLEGSLAERLEAPTLTVQREVRGKKRRGKRAQGRVLPTQKDVDVKAFLMDARLEGTRLHFRLSMPPEGGARPREVVEALVGERVDDYRFRRRRLLSRRGEQWVPLVQRGRVLRPSSATRADARTREACPASWP
jgi:hypothetical protein